MILALSLSWASIGILGYLISLLIFKNLNPLLRLTVSFAIGFGVVSLLMIILGILYNFELTTVLSSLSVIYAILLFSNRKNLKKIKIGLKWTYIEWKFFLIFLVFIATSTAHIILFPELYKDSTIYAQWTKILYQNKKIEFVEGGPTIGMGFASNYPSAHQLIGVFVYLFTGEDWIYLRFTSLLISSIFIFFVYEWSKDIFKDKRLSLYSIVLFISLPLTIFFTRSASHYIYLTFQFSLACYFLQRIFSEKDISPLYASAIFGGFAALTSYLGLLFVPLLLLTFQTSKMDYRKIMISLMLFSLIISPWYLRNLFVLGNPIWPMGGGKYIDPKIQADSMDQLNKISKVSGFNYDTVQQLKTSLRRLLFSYLDYTDASNYNGLNPIFILFSIPAVFLWLIKKDRKMYFFVVWFIIILAFHIIVFNYWNRYLILISVPTIFLSVYLIKYMQKFGMFKWLLVGFIAILYLNSLFLAFLWDECPENKGKTSQILNNLGDYQKISEICHGDYIRLAEWANENLPKDVFIATTDYRLYYYERRVTELKSWKLRDMLYSTDINETVDVLKSNGITHLAVTRGTEDVDRYPEYFEFLKRFGKAAIYRIVYKFKVNKD